ncbi:MAG: hypothetical protein Q4G64_07665 [bacterium]|nr:hypothetical protein [bacterium]
MGTDRIAALASRNDGLITLSQLAKLGFTRRLASGRLARGVWRRILPGVYQTSLTPVTWHQRARAALMWGGPRAVLSHESAAWLLGLVRRAPSGVDITLPRTMRRRSGSASTT